MVDIAALQRAHPEWGIVDAIPAPNGGIWAVGRDGGVFSLDANGGTSGALAPFFGAYTTLAPENRQGDRYFTKIVADSSTGGYTLISNREGQNYNFVGDRPIGGDKITLDEPVKAPVFGDAQLRDLTAVLRAQGLESLIDDAWAYYKNPQGAAGDASAVLQWLPTTPQYQQRFPGLKDLADRGEAWTPAQWSSFYNTAQDLAASYGLPAGYVDREDIGKMIAGNVSANELQGRIQAAGESIAKADPAVIAKMRSWGVTDGDLTAWYLDPDKAQPLIQRKAEVTKAGIGVAAERAGYNVGLDTAGSLFNRGVDEAAAEQGFTSLAGQHALFANTAGESMTGEDITTEEQIGAQFLSDVKAQEEITTRRSRRRASFEGGGGAAGGSTGKTGLG